MVTNVCRMPFCVTYFSVIRLVKHTNGRTMFKQIVEVHSSLVAHIGFV
jgi:hypothetical protein